MMITTAVSQQPYEMRTFPIVLSQTFGTYMFPMNLGDEWASIPHPTPSISAGGVLVRPWKRCPSQFPGWTCQRARQWLQNNFALWSPKYWLIILLSMWYTWRWSVVNSWNCCLHTFISFIISFILLYYQYLLRSLPWGFQPSQKVPRNNEGWCILLDRQLCS